MNRRVIVIVAVALGVGVVYLGVRLATLALSMSNAYSSAQSLLSSTPGIAPDALSRSLALIGDQTAWASASAEDPLVTSLEILPGLGDDIHALRMAAISANQLVKTGQPVFKLAAEVESRSKMHETPLGDPKLVLALRDGVNQFIDAAEKSNANFASVYPSTLHFGLADNISKLKHVIGQTAVGLSNLRSSSNLVTKLFDSAERKTWFVATQNLAELRATGGLLGSFALIQIENGQVKLLKTGADKNLLERGPVDFSGYPEQIKTLWGADLKDWRDFGVSAHVPYAAELIKAGYKQKFGTDLDGVVFLGQGELAKLLGATGELSVWGQKIDKSNAVTFLTKTIYARYADVDKKNAFVSSLMAELLPKLSSPSLNLGGLMTAAIDDQTGDEPFIWEADPAQQKIIRQLGVSGEVSQAPGPDVTVSFNNGGGNKLDAYLTASVTYLQGTCGTKTANGVPGRKSQILVTLKNNAPKKGLPGYVVPRLDLDWGQSYVTGSNRELVSIYTPVGSTDDGMLLDGTETDFKAGQDRSHPVYVFDLELLPGQKRTLTINIVEPISQANGSAFSGEPSLRVTPMISRPSTKIATASRCEVNR
jgi:hypothetical protein